LKKLIVSPVGMSMFLNILDSDEQTVWRTRLNRLSNRSELNGDDLQKLTELKTRAQTRLQESSIAECRRMSAELNGLWGLYSETKHDRADHHILIGTDTFIGKQAVEVIETYLRDKDFVVESIIPKKLNADSTDDFSNGMKDLLNECQARIPHYRRSGYEVIFNLTAALKALQSYLNIVGMFYADRLVYIFSGSDQLMTIPRLPVKIDTDRIVSHANEFAFLAAGGSLPIKKLSEIPEALLKRKPDNTMELSEWGVLVWNTVKDDILSKTLLDFPWLTYEKSFRRDFDSTTPSFRIRLQEKLAFVSCFLELDAGNPAILKTDGGIQYDNYSGKKLQDGTPIGHFRLNNSDRVSCTMPKNGGLLLRHCGPHDYVNNNP
jgi:putative CRISPR-associated protein (TIGR02619 family)